jgi:PPOX class probable F420-dependent enzyme
VVRNTRGSVFSLCRRSREEPERFPRYPRLPVVECEGYEPSSGSGTLDELPEWAHDLVGRARVGHLGLVDRAGQPRVLPVTYAIWQGAAWTVIDNKPKLAGREPARVGWLRRHPRAAITVDRYADDWSELGWVQLLGQMAVLDGPPSGPGMEVLAARYPQYRVDPPPGPLLRLSIDRAVWWQAAGSQSTKNG